ncbi:MAG: hypothetical protein HYY02_06800 [Chloroflexi bacterium]|nr:hypothetical protein [Chloroflexota bacterium]
MADPTYRALLLGSPEEAVATYQLPEQERQLAQYVAALTGYPMFRDLLAEEIAAMMSAASVEQYGPGTLVVRPGSLGGQSST